MGQIKIYGLREHLAAVRDRLSDVVHSCVVDALEYPEDKRAHRFFPLEREDFRYPPGRTERHTIIEISMFEGRSVAAKKRLLRLLFERLERECGIGPVDVEVTIFETPRHNWGIRGAPGDELDLDYRVEV
jgi:phenylpyruvate tautomerase PptA (4-oxalocrotonate tautomerase family)